MQRKTHKVSLNSVRTFSIVAKTGSISGAASELNITPSAVSHQIKNLEDTMGVSLFLRGNNSIELTDLGSRLFDEVVVGIQIIEKSISGLHQDLNEISLKVGVSFAVRWLIPALEDFKKQFPLVKIRIETFNHSEIAENNDADLVIAYKLVTNDTSLGTTILKDFSRPAISPKLLSNVVYKEKSDFINIPALVCTTDNWDWKYWAQKMDIKYEDIDFAHSFDSDDATIRAAVAGFGMVLATPLVIQAELETESLVLLPHITPVLTGEYCIIPGRRKTRMIEEFRSWLIASLSGKE